MSDKNNNKSAAYIFISHAWENENTNSYSRLNSLMDNVIKLAIDANMNFELKDFVSIKKNMRGGYYFGVNSNGKGTGEYYYERAISVNNTSAIKSFENWTGLKPFILKNNRMHIRSNFCDDQYNYSVTGFSTDYKRIYFVAHKRHDYKKEGKRKLFNLDNKEWLVFRKNCDLKLF